jgi:hypothetical protein
MGSNSQIHLKQPILQEIGENKWQVKKRFAVYFSYKSVYKVGVPLNFKTNLASIPRIFWAVYPPFGMYGRGAVAHDFMYSKKLYPRKVCDYGFRELMKQNKVGFFTRNLFYISVRLFGWLNYGIINR